jgi:DNA-binding PadR family transcriptional regulator
MTTRQEWLLMALAHRKGQPLTPAQIQKAMFLMSAEARSLVSTRFYEFVPYNYGPFDASVYHDLDKLALDGLVATMPSGGRNWKLYAVTPAGLAEAAKSKRTANEIGVAYLEKVVDWVSSLSFPQLVRAIYAKYPKDQVNRVCTGLTGS